MFSSVLEEFAGKREINVGIDGVRTHDALL